MIAARQPFAEKLAFMAESFRGNDAHQIKALGPGVVANPATEVLEVRIPGKTARNVFTETLHVGQDKRGRVRRPAAEGETPLSQRLGIGFQL